MEPSNEVKALVDAALEALPKENEDCIRRQVVHELHQERIAMELYEDTDGYDEAAAAADDNEDDHKDEEAGNRAGPAPKLKKPDEDWDELQKKQAAMWRKWFDENRERDPDFLTVVDNYVKSVFNKKYNEKRNYLSKTASGLCFNFQVIPDEEGGFFKSIIPSENKERYRTMLDKHCQLIRHPNGQPKRFEFRYYEWHITFKRMLVATF